MAAWGMMSVPFVAVASAANTFVGMTLGSLVLLWLIPHTRRHYLQKVATYQHELCHGLACLATGGQFHRFHVHPGGSGLCITSGGNRYIVIAAGYIGTILTGAVLLAQSVDCLAAIILLQLMAVVLALSTLKAGDLHTAAIGVIVSSVLGLCSTLQPDALETHFLMNFLGVILVVQGMQALTVLVIVSATNRKSSSDAQALGTLTNRHPLYWAVVLCGISLVVFLVIVGLAVRAGTNTI